MWHESKGELFGKRIGNRKKGRRKGKAVGGKYEQKTMM